MRSYFRILLCANAFLFCASAYAGQADICYSPSVPFTDPNVPTSTTPFDCPLAGQDLTLNQLAAAGWQVVQLVPVVTEGNTSANQLVIQKP